MVKLGLSACLLGEKTRYDGSDKLDPFLTGTLGMQVRFVPVCPEVECGLGVPREPMRLEERGGRPGLFTVGTGRDLTAQMEKTAGVILERLEEEGLWGFIFKSRSPTAGHRLPFTEQRALRKAWAYSGGCGSSASRCLPPRTRTGCASRMSAVILSCACSSLRDGGTRSTKGWRQRICSIFTGGTRFFCSARAGAASANGAPR